MRSLIRHMMYCIMRIVSENVKAGEAVNLVDITETAMLRRPKAFTLSLKTRQTSDLNFKNNVLLSPSQNKHSGFSCVSIKSC